MTPRVGSAMCAPPAGTAAGTWWGKTRAVQTARVPGHRSARRSASRGRRDDEDLALRRVGQEGGAFFGRDRVARARSGADDDDRRERAVLVDARNRQRGSARGRGEELPPGRG